MQVSRQRPAQATLPSVNSPTVPIELEDGWAPEPVWTLPLPEIKHCPSTTTTIITIIIIIITTTISKTVLFEP
jgi:hypothetical protein